mmetsp:Transcript_35917/g.73823  ORF Transcript_35917/g.73823 Transcript_35917/m.73823 type:complete len:256 (-) Transcript_35917:177-944(-)
MGVKKGADYRNKEHNEVMYGEGCAWREDPSDCSTPGLKGRADVSEHGLQYLLDVFQDAVEKVLARYAPGLGDEMAWQSLRPEPASGHMWLEIHTDPSRVKLLTEDEDMKFIMAAYGRPGHEAEDHGVRGDLTNGLGKMLSIFRDETSQVLQESQSETRLLFGTYVCAITLVFYSFMFHRTIKFALSEVERARGLVMAMPTHVLKRENVHTIVAFFAPTDGSGGAKDEDERVEEHDRSPPAAATEAATPGNPKPRH